MTQGRGCWCCSRARSLARNLWRQRPTEREGRGERRARDRRDGPGTWLGQVLITATHARCTPWDVPPSPAEGLLTGRQCGEQCPQICKDRHASVDSDSLSTHTLTDGKQHATARYRWRARKTCARSTQAAQNDCSLCSLSATHLAATRHDVCLLLAAIVDARFVCAGMLGATGHRPRAQWLSE